MRPFSKLARQRQESATKKKKKRRGGGAEGEEGRRRRENQGLEKGLPFACQYISLRSTLGRGERHEHSRKGILEGEGDDKGLPYE